MLGWQAGQTTCPKFTTPSSPKKRRETEPRSISFKAISPLHAARWRGPPLIVRTLDTGGDKPVSYLLMPHGDNPASGLRGVRTGLWRTDSFDALTAAINFRRR